MTVDVEDLVAPSWLVAAIAGSSRDRVLAHPVEVNPAWWERRLADRQLGGDMFPVSGTMLRRADLFALGRAAGDTVEDARRLLWASCSWGTGRKHRNNGSRIRAVADRRGELGELLRESVVLGRTAPEDAYRLLRPAGNAIPYLGPPFFTKFLYFAGGGDAQHPCLILDSVVAGRLRERCGSTSLVGTYAWPSATYAGYCTLMARWAADISRRCGREVAGDELEFHLFTAADSTEPLVRL